MKKTLPHSLLLIVNIPAFLINIKPIFINAYRNPPYTIETKYVICTAIYYAIWTIYGFMMGKTSRKDFLYFIVIYCSLVCACFLLGTKIDGTSGRHSILTLFGLFNFTPLYPTYVFISNWLGMEHFVEIILPMTLLVILSFLGYFIGKSFRKIINA